MNTAEWSKIPWQKRNEIIKFYGLKRSEQVKSMTVSAGVDTIIDDGIREGDIEPIAHLPVEDVLALVPLVSEPVEPEVRPVEIPVEKPTGKKVVKKKKK